MRTGIIFSIILHGAVFSLAYITVPSLVRLDRIPDPEIIEVELVTIDDVNRVPEELVRRQPEPEKPKPKPEPEQPKPEPKAEPEPVKVAEAPPPPDAVPPPPEKKPEVKKEQPKPKPAPKPIAAPKVKPKPPKKFDDRKIAALIDKSLKQQEETQEAKEKKLAAAVANSQVVSLDAKRMTATLVAVVQAQVHKCWSLDPGLKGLQDMHVRIEVELNPDGTIRGWPEFDQGAKSRMRDEGPYRAFAESAQRAILRCAPYELPREMYSEWRNLALNFDPREMVN